MTTPDRCVTCNRAMRPPRVPSHEAPGTIGYGSKGECKSCMNRARKKQDQPLAPNGAWNLQFDHPDPTVSRAAHQTNRWLARHLHKENA